MAGPLGDHLILEVLNNILFIFPFFFFSSTSFLDPIYGGRMEGCNIGADIWVTFANFSEVASICWSHQGFRLFSSWRVFKGVRYDGHLFSSLFLFLFLSRAAF